jgi:DNA-binding MarR family transcriptional regulator
MKNSNVLLHTAAETTNHLHRSALRLFRVLRVTRAAEGLTLSKLGVLGRLYREGTATATELAAYLRIRPQSLTRLVADLEQRKLIVRRSKDEDRRQSLLEITEAGARVLNEDLRDQRVRLAQVIGKELTPAEQELLRIAAGLMGHIAEVTESEIALPSKSKRKNMRRIR